MGETFSRLATQRPRRRSTQAEYRAFFDALVEIVAEITPCTVRQVYYQAVVRDLIEKTEAQYDRVQVALVKLRESGEVSWDDMVDGTRWVRKPDSWANPSESIKQAAKVYRKAIWANAKVVPEVWLEKDALAGVVSEETEEWDVGLYVARGYASLPFLYNAARTILWRVSKGKSTAIYHLGDFDPSGRGAAQSIRMRLTQFIINFGLSFNGCTRDAGEFDGTAELIGAAREVADPKSYRVTVEDISEFNLSCPSFTFEELAVTPEQIEGWGLPTRPTKKSDSRTPGFIEKYGDVGSVELDAVDPRTLRALVRNELSRLMPDHDLRVLREVEAEERKGLEMLARRFGKRHARGAA